MTKFQSPGGGAGVPFPRTAEEWQAKINPETGDNFTAAQAEAKVAKDVFGHDHQVDGAGTPIEKGRGSAHNQTNQHKAAIAIAEQAKAALRSKSGWTPALEGAFDPRSEDPERIARALALLDAQEASAAKGGNKSAA